MAQILLFHHALGLTDGVRALAEQIEAGGHTVHTPDLFDGALFATPEEGIAHVESLGGFDTIAGLAMPAAAQHPQASVVAGISMGVVAAHKAAQTVPAFRACIDISGIVPLNAFAPLWQPHTALQVHLAAQDPWVQDEDLPLARSVSATDEDPDAPAVLFEYETAAHLFMDSSTPDHDPALTEVLVRRIHELLA